ncbi:hypothetical protein B0H10DRAFT_2221079 [Mycena sp. CBHHK59/15]|nr:hypothetical protein B0H10DRAFT_2221079 [Mycena sp. CBHHK59/15]
MSILSLGIYHTVQIGSYGYFWLVQTKAKIQELRTKIAFHVPPVINNADCKTPGPRQASAPTSTSQFASTVTSPSSAAVPTFTDATWLIEEKAPPLTERACLEAFATLQASYVYRPQHAAEIRLCIFFVDPSRPPCAARLRATRSAHARCRTSAPGPRWFSRRAVHPSPGGGIELLFAAWSGFDFEASMQSDDFLGAFGRICRVLLGPPSSPYTCVSRPLTTKSPPLDVYARNALQNPLPPPPRVQRDDTPPYQDPQCPHDLQWLDLHWEQGLRRWLPDNLVPCRAPVIQRCL